MRTAVTQCLLIVALLVGSLAGNSAAPSNKSPNDIYETWLTQDVNWIITKEERAAFGKLANDEERDSFIGQFWSQRDPTLDTLRNEFKDSHYERMLYTRRTFSTARTMGWDTPQGRIYVMYGPADHIETKTGPPPLGQQLNAAGTTCDPATTLPVASHTVWHYNQIRKIDHPVDIAFAELCRAGETVAIVNKADFEWLSRPPVPKYKLMCNGTYDPNEKHEGIQLINCLESSPPVQFKDLEEVVSHRVTYTLLPYDVRLDFAKITDITDMLQLTITVKNSDVGCKEEHGIQRVPVRVFGRFTFLTGRIAETFEGLMDEPVSSCSIGNRTYTQAIPMLTGRYTLNLAVRDVNGDRLGTHNQPVIVP